MSVIKLIVPVIKLIVPVIKLIVPVIKLIIPVIKLIIPVMHTKAGDGLSSLIHGTDSGFSSTTPLLLLRSSLIFLFLLLFPFFCFYCFLGLLFPGTARFTLTTLSHWFTSTVFHLHVSSTACQPNRLYQADR